MLTVDSVPYLVVQENINLKNRKRNHSFKDVWMLECPEAAFFRTTVPPAGLRHQVHSFLKGQLSIYYHTEILLKLSDYNGGFRTPAILGWVNLESMANKRRTRQTLLVKWKWYIQVHSLKAF